jgi:hypothetical protein
LRHGISTGAHIIDRAAEVLPNRIQQVSIIRMQVGIERRQQVGIGDAQTLRATVVDRRKVVGICHCVCHDFGYQCPSLPW